MFPVIIIKMILIIIIKSLIIRHISPGLIGVLYTEIRLVEGEKLLKISVLILIPIIFNIFNKITTCSSNFYLGMTQFSHKMACVADRQVITMLYATLAVS